MFNMKLERDSGLGVVISTIRAELLPPSRAALEFYIRSKAMFRCVYGVNRGKRRTQCVPFSSLSCSLNAGPHDDGRNAAAAASTQCAETRCTPGVDLAVQTDGQ
jgi:hypothetical protein